MKQNPPKTASVVLSCRVSELSAPKKHQQKNQKWRCGFYKKKKKESAASRWFEIKLMWEVELLQPPAWLSLDFFLCACMCYLSVKRFKMRELPEATALKPDDVQTLVGFVLTGKQKNKK